VSRKKSYVTVTDQFCGAGGSSSGAQAAGCEVRIALNHWQLAVETHNTNFPNTDHTTSMTSLIHATTPFAKHKYTVKVRWNSTPLNEQQFWMEFRQALHRRITLKGQSTNGRKYSEDYQIGLQRDRYIIHQYLVYRCRSTGSWNLLTTPELKKKFPTIDNQNSEEL
jgi:hypothetical protein